MIDVALVAGLFVLVWVAVLAPPRPRGSLSRRQAFENSLRGESGASTDSPSSPLARRRQVLGGLLVAMVASLVLGLLPTFRIMLVLHLLLVNSFLASVALVVYERDRKAKLGTLPVATTRGRLLRRAAPAPAPAPAVVATEGPGREVALSA